MKHTVRVMFIYSRILTEENKGEVMIAEMFSVQLIWIHISLHLLIYLFKSFFFFFFLYRILLAVNVARPTELSALCRQGGRRRRKKTEVQNENPQHWGESGEKYKQWDKTKTNKTKQKGIFHKKNEHLSLLSMQSS